MYVKNVVNNVIYICYISNRNGNYVNKLYYNLIN